MKVAVLGAGVIGVSTAHALSMLGHEVVVIDRQQSVAQETSFANGGQISATHTTPWAAPHVPFQAFKWMFQADAPLLIKPLRWDPALWRWGLRFLANCTSRHAASPLGVSPNAMARRTHPAGFAGCTSVARSADVRRPTGSPSNAAARARSNHGWIASGLSPDASRARCSAIAG